MHRITSAATLPPAPAWDGGATLARLVRRARSLFVATVRPHRKGAGAGYASRLAWAETALAAEAEQTPRLALLFTDIKDSSGLYHRFGDAIASQIVRAHLEWLERLVERFGGVLIKTMGDGALAAFGDDAAAVAAALAIQAEIGALDRRLGEPGLVLRVGVHAGPCIVSRSGNSFDCFGTTVNVAARLLRVSEGGDVVLCDQTAADPAVARLLAAYPHRPAELRMADAETIRVLRVMLGERLALAG